MVRESVESVRWERERSMENETNRVGVFVFFCAETKASEARTLSNTLGKRWQGVDDALSKQSPLRSVLPVPVVASDWTYPPVTSTNFTSQPPAFEPSPSFNEVPYNHDMLPVPVAVHSALESSRLELPEPPQSDQVASI